MSQASEANMEEAFPGDRSFKYEPPSVFFPGTWLRRLIGLSLVLAAVTFLWSCQRAGSGSSRGSSDSEKHGVEPGNPRRIISLSPNATDILAGVGAFDRVVAVSDYCSYPPSVASLPRVGGWQNASLEEVAGLAPDLVVMAEVQAPFVDSHLQALGIETLVVPSQSLQDVFTAIDAVGRGVGRQKAAGRLQNEVRAVLDRVAERTRGLPKPSVLCVVDRVPGTLRGLYAATRGSFLSRLIEIVGGKPIAPPATFNYGRIGKEAVVTLNPDVVIDMVQGAQGAFAEEPIGIWSELKEIRAVRRGRVHPVREMFVLHASQFVAQTAELFSRLIHPEVFGKDGVR
jgi:iron complex transport system substrate-binding protein